MSLVEPKFFSNPKIPEFFSKENRLRWRKALQRNLLLPGTNFIHPHKNTKSQHFALLPGVFASQRALSILIPEGKSCFLGKVLGFLALNIPVSILD